MTILHLTWTQDRVDTLRQLTGEGMSCSQIGAAMGISRNAIIGKQHRIGLHSKIPPSRALGSKTERKAAQVRKSLWYPRPTEAIDLEPEPPLVDPLPLLDLEPHQCRWPVSGAGYQALFCGAVSAFAQSYCPHHCARAYGRLPPLTRAEREIHMRKLARKYQERVA